MVIALQDQKDMIEIWIYQKWMDVGDELEERTFAFVSTKSLHIISRDEIIPSRFEWSMLEW